MFTCLIRNCQGVEVLKCQLAVRCGVSESDHSEERSFSTFTKRVLTDVFSESNISSQYSPKGPHWYDIIYYHIYIYIPRNHFPPRLSVMCQAMNIIMPYCSVASTRTKLFEVWTFLGRFGAKAVLFWGGLVMFFN